MTKANGAASVQRTEILVFAKAPVPGQVKTRLTPGLGAQAAARLHEQLVRRTVDIALAVEGCSVVLCCAPDCAHPLFRELGAQVSLQAQQGADLGERMRLALSEALERVPRAILIGTDCPSFSAEHLRAARDALHGPVDAVFGPVEDGGYWLVGAAGTCPPVFAAIEWGSAQVMEQTRRQLKQHGLRWQELEPLWDLDRPADLARLDRRDRFVREML